MLANRDRNLPLNVGRGKEILLSLQHEDAFCATRVTYGP